MLEEQKMDKKYLNRSSQPQSKAQALDSKRNTEVTHKPWPRSNKKREGTGNASKNEPYRKSLPTQRGRGQLDRRPRPRGGPNNSMGGTENTGLDDDEPELGSVFSPGSKKQNLNHLLNFMYPTRGGPERREHRPRRLLHHIPHRHEHDLYLRAYCQFVIKEGGDYKANMLDPDVALKWEQIEEIVVRSSGRSECPICLGSPAAARVGVCGHVYCWACVLHYANTHEKQPPPCPVCTTPLHVKDMKPARMLQWKSSTEEVTMRLVRRLRGSTVVEVAPPRGHFMESEATAVLPLEKMQSSPYCKLFSASKQQIREILYRERKEIQNQILEEVDTSEIVYLEQALEMLKSKEEQIDGGFDESKITEDVPETTGPVVYEKLEINDKKFDWFDVSDEGAASVDGLQNQLENLNIDNSIQTQLNPEAPDFNMNDNQPEEFPLIECFPMEEEQTVVNLNEIDKENQAKYFYFYQADDGEQVFLNSLNLRILNASWGALPAAPLVIRGRVLQRETLSLSEQTRKHMPHTAHLPLYCSFDIVELDLQPPYVTVEAINNFSAELDRRARTRARNEREERRRERAYRRAMEGPPKPDFSSDLIFPPAPSYPVPIEPAPPSPETQPSPSSGASPSGMSFAKMASTSGTWRVRKTAVPSPPPPVIEDQESTGPRTLSLSDAIEAALHAPPPPSNGKKKKTKHKVLFATGMQRAD